MVTMRLYEYLYYRLYSWNLKTWGQSDLPQWNALFGVSFMMLLNISLIGLLLQLFGVNIFLGDELPKREIVILMLGLFVLNYFLFIHKSNYKTLANKLKKENTKRRRVNTLLLWLYTMLSFNLVLVVAILIGKLKGLR
jgi:hypothetical protein